LSNMCSNLEVASGNIYYCDDYSWKYYVFRDRLDAGLLQALFTRQVIGVFDGYVLGLAAGGVPVAYVMAVELRLPLDVIVVKKITYPWTTEAGFGAVTVDGIIVYDKDAAKSIGYSDSDVLARGSNVRRYAIERTLKFRGNLSYDFLRGSNALLVDDGIATGYTMIAAIRMLRNNGVKTVIVSTPTASIDGALIVAKEADKVIVLNLRSGPFYAVADAYREWHDVSDDEVLNYLRLYRERVRLI